MPLFFSGIAIFLQYLFLFYATLFRVFASVATIDGSFIIADFAHATLF